MGRRDGRAVQAVFDPQTLQILPREDTDDETGNETAEAAIAEVPLRPYPRKRLSGLAERLCS